MARRKRYSVEQIIRKLREAEVELAKDQKVPRVRRKLGISEQTYYRWRKEYGGLKLDQAKRLKELEPERPHLWGFRPAGRKTRGSSGSSPISRSTSRS